MGTSPPGSLGQPVLPLPDRVVRGRMSIGRFSLPLYSGSDLEGDVADTLPLLVAATLTVRSTRFSRQVPPPPSASTLMPFPPLLQVELRLGRTQNGRNLGWASGTVGQRREESGGHTQYVSTVVFPAFPVLTFTRTVRLCFDSSPSSLYSITKDERLRGTLSKVVGYNRWPETGSRAKESRSIAGANRQLDVSEGVFCTQATQRHAANHSYDRGHCSTLRSGLLVRARVRTHA